MSALSWFDFKLRKFFCSAFVWCVQILVISDKALSFLSGSDLFSKRSSVEDWRGTCKENLLPAKQ